MAADRYPFNAERAAETNRPAGRLSIYQRLAAVRESLAHHMEPSAADTQARLISRAKLLARKRSCLTTQEDGFRAVEFRLNHEHHAIAAEYVQEVLPLSGLASIPGVPDFVLGIMNVRGRIISVIDLRTLFGVPERAPNPARKVVILKAAAMTFGLCCDEIVGLRTIIEKQLQKKLPSFAEIHQEYLMGMDTDGCLILDGGRLLSSEEIVIHQYV